MKIWNLIFVCSCFVGLTQSVWSQKANEPAKPGILGYLDPRTGAFRPVAQNPAENEVTEPITPTTGKFVFHFTITIASTNLGSDTIVCAADAAVFESANLFSVTESATVKATVTGSTATCTVTIPYSWPLKTASTDTVSLNFEVLAVGGTSTGGQPTRNSSQSLPTIKVPANGATTTETLASTI
jgi:hypothetical protein